MSERDDYLWDRRGEVDATIASLERALAPLAWTPRELPPSLPGGLRPQAKHDVGSPRRWPWLVAAAALLAALAFAFLQLRGEAALAPGGAPRTYSTSKTSQQVAAGSVADLTLLPGTELRFARWTADELRFALVAGEVDVRVAAAAGFVHLATPVAELAAESGRFRVLYRGDAGRLRVAEGAVAADSTVAAAPRRAFVPAGAAVDLSPKGIGTPCFDDAADELRKAVTEYDDARRRGVVGDTAYAVVKRCRERRDSLVLWHLLQEPDASLRSTIEYELYRLVGSPTPIVSKQLHWETDLWLAYLRAEAWGVPTGK